MDRYDRQVRLWGNAGQDLVRRSHLCVVSRGETPLLQEILKNYVLLGGSRITLYLDAEGGRSNHLLYGDLREALAPLNPEPLELTTHRVNLNSFVIPNSERYSAIVQVGLPVGLRHEGDLSPPVIHCFARGLCGYVHLQLSEPHLLLDPRNEYTIPSLRLDNPWGELSQYMDSIHVEQMDDVQLSQLPFAVLLYKTLNTRRAATTAAQLKTVLAETYLHGLNPRAQSDLNYAEAVRFAHLAFTKNRQDGLLNRLTRDVCPLLEQENKLGFQDTMNQYIATLLSTLKRYADMHNGHFPLDATLPDMESTTHNYNALKRVYEAKAAKDLADFKKLIPGDIEIPEHVIDEFCRNTKTTELFEPLGVCRGPPDSSAPPLLDALKRCQEGKTVDLPQLNVTFSYPTETYIAGLVTQELVKLITHQFVPIDNCFVYDALDPQNMATCRL
ncbi:Ula1p KNAG_0L00400 [Huiozyma naganishii CBS 8797]|uniref:Uncharacterized protein n=1 Tax=Huiozyma naganishii (strain ATCC MYA-139 / BCRC 22969 / CBS 8797 / KCTC 17520 / NBRC 10181 / NCYC 3082 / Yp74L-3) TaxID=1071383 RepID=J7RS00_HUIN7|nr:hypothetical protein KNAG_0L00400 [Kazachstania naganishii CBS 8797]CCK72663.1 hypothetical protein KNAG_0L00400 [Kazachstania naganishii CBS 8797]